MKLGFVAVFVCLSTAVNVRANSSSSDGNVDYDNNGSAGLPIKNFVSRSKRGDPTCTWFDKTEMNESGWAKGKMTAPADIAEGQLVGARVKIADITLKVGHKFNQHVPRLCTIDARNSDYFITGYKIKSTDGTGSSIVLKPEQGLHGETKQLTFAAQANQKGKGFELLVEVYGYKNGSRNTIPIATCVNPRNIDLNKINCPR